MYGMSVVCEGMININSRLLKRALECDRSRVACQRQLNKIFISRIKDRVAWIIKMMARVESQQSRANRRKNARGTDDEENSRVTIVVAGAFSPTRHTALIFMGFHILRVTHTRISRSFFPTLPRRPSTRRIVPVFEERRVLPLYRSNPVADSVDARPLLRPPSFTFFLCFSFLLFSVSVAAASRSRMHRNPDVAKREIGSGVPLCRFLRQCDFRCTMLVVGFRSGSRAESSILA